MQEQQEEALSHLLLTALLSGCTLVHEYSEKHHIMFIDIFMYCAAALKTVEMWGCLL